jgi:hypothetical protein
MAITQPTIIRPERNSNLNCNSSRYSHIPNIKSIMWLYLDELQFKFEFRSGRMTFGKVMTLELVFFVQIWSCPDFSLTSFDILTWYLVSGYIGRSYSVRSNFVPVEWLLAELWPLNLYILFKFEVVRSFLWRPLYSHIPNIKSIYQRTSRKIPDNLKFEQKIQVQWL